MTTTMKEKKNARYIVRALKPSFLPSDTQETQDNVFTKHFVLNALVIYLSESIFFFSLILTLEILLFAFESKSALFSVRTILFILSHRHRRYFPYSYFSLTEHAMWSLLILCQA